MRTKHFLENYEPTAEKPIPGEQEPRVITADVATILRAVVRPDDEDTGSSVSLVAENADTSTRTVYRVLSETTQTLSLDLADRLCLAAGSHVAACQLLFPDGTISNYFDGENGGIILW